MSQQEMSTGQIIGEIEEHIKRAGTGRTVLVNVTTLQGWLDGVVYAAALLDPDNQPLTREQLARMKLVKG